MTPRVTVALISYNAASYLQTAVDSVLAQSFHDFQVWIVDDGSSDPDVPMILRPYEADERVVVTYWPTSEFERRLSVRYATLINWVVANTESEFVTFLCGDDSYFMDRLERMVAKLDEGHDVVYGSQELHREGQGRIGRRAAEDELNDAWYKVDLNSVMLTREAFKIAGGFPTHPMMWRDSDAHFWRRLTDAGYVFVPVDNPGSPTDRKLFRDEGVDMRVRRGLTPW